MALQPDFSDKASVVRFSRLVRIYYQRLSGGVGNEDECVQEVLIKYFLRSKNRNVRFCVIDYLRTYTGLKSRPYYNLRLNLALAVSPEALRDADEYLV